MPKSLFLIIPTFFAAGCFDNITSEFPAELAPLEDNLAEWPEAAGDDLHPEKLSMVDAQASDFWLVHARGYIKAPLEDVYAAARMPDVAVHRKEVDKWTVAYAEDGAEECEDLPEEFEYCMRLSNTVDDLITVKYDVVWRFGTVAHDKEDRPTLVLGRWQKTWGSEVIELLEGSVLLEPTDGEDDSVTSIELIEHLDALQGSREHARDFLKQYYANILEALDR